MTIFLKLGDELIALLHNIGVLLVLVIGSVGLNDTLSGHTVDSTWDALSGDELGEITMTVVKRANPKRDGGAYRSKKSTETPKSLAMLSRPTTR